MAVPDFRSSRQLRWWTNLFVLASGVGVHAGVTSQPEAEIRFNRDVLPILSENCLSCHGPDSASRKGDLRLDRRENALAEASSGAHAIVPGHPEESELVARIITTDPDDMMPRPKSGKKISPQEIEILKQWIRQGAPYEKHWAFLPPAPVAPPDGASATSPIDRFILARCAQEGVAPSAEADRRTLIRRLSLDLTGLPPTLEETAAFVADERPDAYERVVDRLLASPHYGEKWARWWLDLAHYGDSDGIRLDDPRPSAWRYRQWVVDALNRDLPFDEFTVEQLAGDLLPGATIEQRIGTGFLRNTISDRQTGNADPELGHVQQLIDRTSTVSTVWLGLSAACAQCHDHKFDPISQREFYQLYAFFENAEEVNIDAPRPGEWEKQRPARETYERAREELLAPLAAPLAELQAKWEQKMLATEAKPNEDHAWDRALELLLTSWGRGQGEGQREGLNLMKIPLERRTAAQQERLQDYFLANGRIVAPPRFAELHLDQAVKRLTELRKQVPSVTRAQTVETAGTPRITTIHLRGDFHRPGDVVGPATPAALPPLAAAPAPAPTRLDLARWLVSRDNPLTARVTVNRLWQEVFGRGLVGTSDNFGLRGERPTHPELLDWLATDFSSDWSIKRLLRLLVASATYRQSSHARNDLAVRDPGNTLLAHQARLRLSAENLRDTALAVSGLLDLTVGGPSVRPPQPESVTKENSHHPWVPSAGSGIHRRGLYTFIQRLTPFGQLTNFDFPGTSAACTRRERSNTPLQALNLLNDPAFVEAAQALAARVWREAPAGDVERIQRLFALAVSRPPTVTEEQRLRTLLAWQTDHFEQDAAAARTLAAAVADSDRPPAVSAAWVTLASVILNLDEFINRE